jgi:hypothetical protein
LKTVKQSFVGLGHRAEAAVLMGSLRVTPAPSSNKEVDIKTQTDPLPKTVPPLLSGG